MGILSGWKNLLDFLRRPLDLLEKSMSENIKLNPSHIQIYTLTLSMIYMIAPNTPLRLVLLSIILFLSWLDEAIVRVKKIKSKISWMKKTPVDRISEGFIFASHLDQSVGKIFFTLYLVNTALTIRGVKVIRHLNLPLRLSWFVFLLIQIVI